MTGRPKTSTWRDVQAAVFRHKKKAMTFLVLAVGLATLAAVYLPKKYRSNGRLLVRIGRENALLDTTARLSQEPVVSVPQLREFELNSVVEILRSRALAEQVVDSLGPEFILGDGRGAEGAEEAPPAAWRARVHATVDRMDDWLGRATASQGLPQRNRAILLLLERCQAQSLRKSNLIAVDCLGPSPEWSQAVVARLIELYLDEHIRLNRPQGSRQFFADQAARLRRELAEREAELRDLKTATGLASPVEQRQAMVMRVARLEDDLLQVEAARTVSESKVLVLRKQLAVLPEKRITQETAGFGNESTDRMRDQLYQLEIKKEEAAAKYAESHPHLRKIEEQLGAARDIVDRQPLTRTQVTTATSRPHEEVQVALLLEEPALASLQAKAGTLRQQLAGVRGELKALNDNEMRIAVLQREVELERTAYTKYSTNLEQARIDQALEEQRMSNISVAQPATYEPKPVFPWRGGLLAIGLLIGCAGGVGTALLVEWRNRSFRVPEDIERRLEMAVLASIPRLRDKDLRLHDNGKHGRGCD